MRVAGMGCRAACPVGLVSCKRVAQKLKGCRRAFYDLSSSKYIYYFLKCHQQVLGRREDFFQSRLCLSQSAPLSMWLTRWGFVPTQNIPATIHLLPTQIPKPSSWHSVYRGHQPAPKTPAASRMLKCTEIPSCSWRIRSMADTAQARSCALKVNTRYVSRGNPLNYTIQYIPFVGFLVGTLTRGPGNRNFILTARHCHEMNKSPAANPLSSHAALFNYRVPCNTTRDYGLAHTFSDFLQVGSMVGARRDVDPVWHKCNAQGALRLHMAGSPFMCSTCQVISFLFEEECSDVMVVELLQDIPPEWGVTYAGQRGWVQGFWSAAC